MCRFSSLWNREERNQEVSASFSKVHALRCLCLWLLPPEVQSPLCWRLHVSHLSPHSTLWVGTFLLFVEMRKLSFSEVELFVQIP